MILFTLNLDSWLSADVQKRSKNGPELLVKEQQYSDCYSGSASQELCECPWPTMTKEQATLKDPRGTVIQNQKGKWKWGGKE